MSSLELQTPHLTLRPRTLEEAFAEIAALPAAARAEVSPRFLAQLNAAPSADPWLHGFAIVHRDTGEVVGTAGFKGPPDAEGVAEIAYGVRPEDRGQGYATEAAAALTRYALASARVCLVRAHTLPQSNASARVLTKCGFRCLGEVHDPEDGLVWRWERTGRGAKPQPVAQQIASRASLRSVAFPSFT